MYRLQLVMRSVRRLFTGTKSFSKSDLQFLVESVNSIYGIDLSSPQHGHKQAQVKQALVAFLDESGEYKTDTEMTNALVSVGVASRGFSRRNVTHMINTLGTEITDLNVYREFKKNANSVL
jgi:hypothetical protein